MKQEFSDRLLPNDAIFLTCSSHEARCLGIIQQSKRWNPHKAIVFHYDDENPKREANHMLMVKELEDRRVPVESIPFTEAEAVRSLHDSMKRLRDLLLAHDAATAIVFD